VWGEWRHEEVKQRVGRGAVGWGVAVLGAPFIGLEDGSGGGAVRETTGGGGALSRPLNLQFGSWNEG
jgi:hypothetical protein